MIAVVRLKAGQWILFEYLLLESQQYMMIWNGSMVLRR